jgi:two-component system, cell cycle response regulator DivK
MSPSHLILHVEDNPGNRLLIKRLLLSEGYRILEAENARQAINLLQKNKPDLILMDINMPEVDGYTLTHQIRNIPELGKIPIVAITANVMRGDRERVFKAGCDGYIEKPINVDTFLEQVAGFIA